MHSGSTVDRPEGPSTGPMGLDAVPARPTGRTVTSAGVGSPDYFSAMSPAAGRRIGRGLLFVLTAGAVTAMAGTGRVGAQDPPAPVAAPIDAVEVSDGSQSADSPPFLGRARIGCAYQNCMLSSPRLPNPYHPYQAVDFNLAPGTPIRAAGPGVVAMVDEELPGEGDPPGCTGGPATEAAYCGNPGRFVAIDHPVGSASVYKHLSRSLVVVGQRVERGQIIGIVGSTQSPSLHLHYDEQPDLTRFNTEDPASGYSRSPIGTMAYWQEGPRMAPESWGDANWVIPRNTPVDVRGWSTPPNNVATARGLRSAITRLNASQSEGPFILRLARDIDLTGAQLEYTSDEMLIVVGGGHRLRSGVGQRVLYASGPALIELTNVELQRRGRHPWRGKTVFARGAVVLNGYDGPPPISRRYVTRVPGTETTR